MGLYMDGYVLRIERHASLGLVWGCVEAIDPACTLTRLGCLNLQGCL